MDTKRLTELLAKELEIGKEDVETLIEGLAKVVGECASQMDTISFNGFGSFEPKKRLERVAVHPATGKRLLVPPKLVLSFRPSTSLKQKIRNGN